MDQSMQRWAKTHAGVSCSLFVTDAVFLKKWKIYLKPSKEWY